MTKQYNNSLFPSSFALFCLIRYILKGLTFGSLRIQACKMGMAASLMGKGVPSAQMATFALGALHQQFVDRKIDTPEDFHSAILDIFNAFNSALPGKHYDVPSGNEIKTLYKAWKEAPESEKRDVFINFMKKKVQPNKLDEATMITGIVTPPAAMAAKRAGESLPQLKILKMIPDVIFVPSATILALISSKVTKRMLKGNVRSS